jgi:hypothetical protein
LQRFVVSQTLGTPAKVERLQSVAKNTYLVNTSDLTLASDTKLLAATVPKGSGIDELHMSMEMESIRMMSQNQEQSGGYQ